MKRLDSYSAIFWLVVAIGVVLHSQKLGLGTLRNPGPGFLFFCGSVFLGILSLTIFLSSLRTSEGDRTKEGKKAFGNIRWKKVIYIVISIILYGLLLEKLGYLLSTFFLIGFLLHSIEAKRWYVVILVACLSSVLSYALFGLWLQVRLPQGLLGF